MRIAGEAQATFDGDDRWLVSVFGYPSGEGRGSAMIVRQ